MLAKIASPAPTDAACASATTFSAYDVVFRPATAPRSLRGHGTTVTRAGPSQAFSGAATTTRVGSASPGPSRAEPGRRCR